MTELVKVVPPEVAKVLYWEDRVVQKAEWDRLAVQLGAAPAARAVEARDVVAGVA